MSSIARLGPGDKTSATRLGKLVACSKDTDALSHNCDLTRHVTYSQPRRNACQSRDPNQVLHNPLSNAHPQTLALLAFYSYWICTSWLRPLKKYAPIY